MIGCNRMYTLKSFHSIGNSSSKNIGIETKGKLDARNTPLKPNSSKNSSCLQKKTFEQKPALAAPLYSNSQSMSSSPTRSTTIANQLSLNRRSSGSGAVTSSHVDPLVPNSTEIGTNDLCSVGLMVSSMTLHHRPSSRNSKSSKDQPASATNSKNNSRSTTPTRRRSSGYGQTSSRRNSKQGSSKTFWSGNEEFYFPDSTQDELGKEEMEWITQASALDDKFYLKSTPPPKVHVVLKKTGKTSS